MNISNFKSKKINVLFVWVVAFLCIPVFMVAEYLLLAFICEFVCENEVSNAIMLFHSMFAIANVINCGIAAFVIANVLILWNRISVSQYKKNTKAVRVACIKQQKRNAMRRGATRKEQIFVLDTETNVMRRVY